MPRFCKWSIGRIRKQIDDYNKKHTDLPMRIHMGVSTANKGDSLKAHLKLAGEDLGRAKEKQPD